MTGRYYVGMRSTCKEDDNYMGSGKVLRYSIRKYGVENHTKEILSYHETRELLVEAEILAITADMITDKNCMNIRLGGSGGFTSEEAKKGRLATDKILFEKFGDDFRIIINQNYHNNMSETEKIAFSNKVKVGQQSNGYNNITFKNKRHSDKTKQLMSKPKNIGETNSQFGTCWITKEGINKKIKKEDLDTFITDGWVQGRK